MDPVLPWTPERTLSFAVTELRSAGEGFVFCPVPDASLDYGS
jgi:hypothetical protein